MPVDELYHLGLPASEVTPRVLFLEEGIDVSTLFPEGALQVLARRREYTVFRGCDEYGSFTVCETGIGCPQLAIAVEEFARAGARSQVLVAMCRCRACSERSDGAHTLVLPFGAAREEGTTRQYAPLAFPAVPDPTLLRMLRRSLPNATLTITRTVDIPEMWLDEPPSGPNPVDLGSAALFVVAAARGMAAATVIIGATGRMVPAAFGRALMAAAGAALRPAS